MQFQVYFTDETLLSTDGDYGKVSALMKEDNPNEDRWMIQSKATIMHEFGGCQFVLNLWNNKEIYIDDYIPSDKSFYGNKDLECLVCWAGHYGWGQIKITTLLAKENIKFWKYFWAVDLVDCDYFEEIFGDKNDIMLDLDTEI